MSLLHTLQRWSSVWLLFCLVCGFYNFFFFFNECYLLKIWRYHIRIKVSTCSWKIHLLTSGLPSPMTPCWSCKANALVDKVCKLTLTLCPSSPFDLFRLPSSPPNIWVFHFQVSLLVEVIFFRKMSLMIWFLFLMEISMVIYFYHNPPHNNYPSRKSKL